jgi:hypothetical protein
MHTQIFLDTARFRDEELRRLSSRPERLMALELARTRERRFRLVRRRPR